VATPTVHAHSQEEKPDVAELPPSVVISMEGFSATVDLGRSEFVVAYIRIHTASILSRAVYMRRTSRCDHTIVQINTWVMT
jgi:hypothetical protein